MAVSVALTVPMAVIVATCAVIVAVVVTVVIMAAVTVVVATAAVVVTMSVVAAIVVEVIKLVVGAWALFGLVGALFASKLAQALHHISVQTLLHFVFLFLQRCGLLI